MGRAERGERSVRWGGGILCRGAVKKRGKRREEAGGGMKRVVLEEELGKEEGKRKGGGQERAYLEAEWSSLLLFAIAGRRLNPATAWW